MIYMKKRQLLFHNKTRLTSKESRSLVLRAFGSTYTDGGTFVASEGLKKPSHNPPIYISPRMSSSLLADTGAFERRGREVYLKFFEIAVSVPLGQGNKTRGGFSGSVALTTGLPCMTVAGNKPFWVVLTAVQQMTSMIEVFGA